jgi:hypothetical protein
MSATTGRAPWPPKSPTGDIAMPLPEGPRPESIQAPGPVLLLKEPIKQHCFFFTFNIYSNKSIRLYEKEH